MTKKIIVSLVSLFIVFIGITIYTEENLSKYTVYYAQHLPHSKNQHPVPIIILENIDSIPNLKSKIYKFDSSEAPIIYTDKQYLQLFTDSIIFDDVDNKSYDFSIKNGKLTSLSISEKNTTYTNPNSKEFKAVNQKAIWQKIDRYLEPIVKGQPKPKVNLQWLFNKRYEKRF